jgi:hypothetical protein
MIFTNQEAHRQMLSLWATLKAGGKLPHGLGRWKTLFDNLRDMRPWGIRDRLLETGGLNDWRERVGRPEPPIEI